MNGTPSLSTLPSSIAWMTKWERLSNEPILSPSGTGFDARGTFNPAAFKVGQLYCLYFRAQDEKGVSTIGLAVGMECDIFGKMRSPFFKAPVEGESVEDPRIHFIYNTMSPHVLTYTHYDNKNAALHLANQTQSLDIMFLYGTIIPAGKWGWCTHWTKAGAILERKVSGRWFIYFMGDQGEGDGTDQTGIAVSSNLATWKEAFGMPVLPRREGFFDSRVVEPGPPPIMTEHGILLIYNGADDKLVYRTGWALFDEHDPTKLLARSDEPIFAPKLPWEQVGQTPNVVFAEGCIKEDNRILFYYGAADKYVGVAEAVRK